MRSPEEQTAIEIAALLHDQPFCVSRDHTRNIRTLFRRFSHEGFSFLSKTLPALGKSLDRALSGNVAFSLPSNFKKFKKTCFPHFLGSALRRVFDDNGILLANPCYLTVQWIRTVCFYAYKVEVPFSENQIQAYCDAFVTTDLDVGSITFSESDSPLLNLMRYQLRDLTDSLSTPAYGPGISSNCSREDKYNVFVPPSKMRNHFGRQFFHLSDEWWLTELFLNFFASYFRAFFGILVSYDEDCYLDSPWGRFSPSKVLFVPKDSRGPRVICCEDSRRMYAQKSLQKSLYSQIERSVNFGGRVNFTDQSINQRLTYDSSNSTLDLKDASDRVSYALVASIFPQKLFQSMDACRSPLATLPNGLVVELNKFAPMGSALCFPVMALIAYTAVTSAIYLAGGPLPTKQDKVFVYGDDIIVPNEYAFIAMDALEKVGLAVNRQKSFVNSRFRESCGQDTLDQTSVNALKKKRFCVPLEKGRYKGKGVLRNCNGLIHSVSLMNRSKEFGFKNLYSELESFIDSNYGSLPYGTNESSYLCKVVDDKLVSAYNRAAGFEVNGKLRALVVRDESTKVDLHPYAKLRKSFIESNNSNVARFDDVCDLVKTLLAKPVRLDEIGARQVFLQHKTLTKWGLSYA